MATMMDLTVRNEWGNCREALMILHARLTEVKSRALPSSPAPVNGVLLMLWTVFYPLP